MKAMKKSCLLVLASVLAFGLVQGRGEVYCSGDSAAVAIHTGNEVEKNLPIAVAPFLLSSGQEAAILLDGTVLFSSTKDVVFDWQPQTLGKHVLKCTINKRVITNKTVTVKSLAFDVAKEPNPPTEVDDNLSITPPTRNFETGGGGAAIVVSGSGTWTASASEPWITLNTTSGAVGYPVAYTVSATTNVEARTGYVYVSGHVHTVTQDGLGGSIKPTSATFETGGGIASITVTAPSRMGWQARANCNWVKVKPTRGVGPGSVTFTVAPYNEVRTRSGTLTVAGNTFTVFQYGRRMKISPVSASYDFYTHVIPITVDALSTTEWTVTPQNSWISVVDAGKGKGGDLVTVAIAENPSWKARTGTVKIGTETFTVVQAGRTELEFGIDPESTTASVEGANGLIAVTATPDLPWSAASKANWLTVYASTANGAGNGNVAYSAAPNPTLYQRTGKIVVTPGDTNVAAATHTVTQPAAVSALSGSGYEFEAAGESCEVRVSLSDIVQWQVQNTNNWLTVVGATNRVGPGTVTLQAAPNETVYPKEGTVTMAWKAFKVSQKARGVEVEYDTKLFGTDGGSDSISIHPDGQVSWTAVASDPTWITIFQGDSGTGDGEILYIVSPYVGDGEARTGTITVGDKVVWISQRAYDLSIDPKGAVVPGNNGAGEFGVSAGIGDVWRAIVTEPWITIIEGYEEGTGNGIVRFVWTDNDTGKTRTGKIIVAGEVYTLEQKARVFVPITTEAGHGGRVEGGGSYYLGAEATLTAIPDSGYAFSYWTGAVESMENPLVVRVDVPKTYTAVFEPLPIAFESVVAVTNGVALSWNNLAWATHYLLFRGPTSVPSSATVLADIPNTGDCSYVDGTGELEVEYWYWIEAEGVEDDVMSDPMTGKRLTWPEVQDEAGVAAVLGEAADARLAEQIGSVEEYNDFRAWVEGKGLDPKEVQASERAWPSYLLGADALLENEPKIQIVGYSSGEGAEKDRAAGFSWEIRVTIHDGETAVDVDSAKVASMFEATRQIGDWTKSSLLPLTAKAKGRDGDVLLFEVSVSEAVPGAILRLGRGIAVAKYLVVDMSGGPYAASWPVEYLDWEPEGGFNTEEYKTTKLVLRRIEAGTFKMGSPQDELGRSENEDLHAVTLSKPYWMGVFEVTQKQWELAMGDNPARHVGNKRPVECVSYEAVRGSNAGTNWPANNAVDATSFMGVLRAKTGLAFDLPTEAQWEYACRAGTTTALNSGKNLETEDAAWGDVDSPNMGEVGQYDNRYAYHAEAGTHLPNAWGLYDMHGNVWEWCLDWYEESLGTGAATDPKGSQTPTYRVNRGGSWFYGPSYCRSSFRGHYRNYPSFYHGDLGLRVACGMEE